MKYDRSEEFRRQFKNIGVRAQHGFVNAIKLFEANTYDNRLDNHELSRGVLQDYRSIDILKARAKQYIAIYKEETIGNETVAVFIAIGNKDDLYRERPHEED